MKKLGFGLMRLPVLNGNQDEIDLEQVKEMADMFLENGFTYFDTSFVYHNGQSEHALRQAVVERHPRDSFTIATKFPTFAVQSEEQVEGIFAQQLEKLGTEYIDYYLLHTLNRKFYNGADGKGGVVKTRRLFDHVRKWRDAGKIRHMGFSFHDSPELLDQILTENPDVEFVQIILNYFDWESYFIQSKGCYENMENRWLSWNLSKAGFWRKSRNRRWNKCVKPRRTLPPRHGRYVTRLVKTAY